MLFHSMLFYCNVNEMLQKLNSCFYQLAYSKIVSFLLNVTEPMDDISEDLLYLQLNVSFFDIGLNQSCQGFSLVSELSNWINGTGKLGDGAGLKRSLLG